MVVHKMNKPMKQANELVALSPPSCLTSQEVGVLQTALAVVVLQQRLSKRPRRDDHDNDDDKSTRYHHALDHWIVTPSSLHWIKQPSPSPTIISTSHLDYLLRVAVRILQQVDSDNKNNSSNNHVATHHHHRRWAAVMAHLAHEMSNRFKDDDDADQTAATTTAAPWLRQVLRNSDTCRVLQRAVLIPQQHHGDGAAAAATVELAHHVGPVAAQLLATALERDNHDSITSGISLQWLQLVQHCLPVCHDEIIMPLLAFAVPPHRRLVTIVAAAASSSSTNNTIWSQTLLHLAVSRILTMYL